MRQNKTDESKVLNTMVNVKEQEALLQKELDKQILEGTTSGWMQENASRINFNGDGEIKISRVESNSLCYETFSLAQRKGVCLFLERDDVDELGFGLAAANTAAEFQRTRLIPEIDAYRYSKMSSATKISETHFNASFSCLLDQLGRLLNLTGGREELIISMNRRTYDRLIMFGEGASFAKTIQFKQGGVEFGVKAIYGVPIIPVPSARMKSEYRFTDTGFVPTESAKDISWIICLKSAPIAISQIDTVRINAEDFSPGWTVDYYMCHGLLVTEEAKAISAVCFGGD